MTKPVGNSRGEQREKMKLPVLAWVLLGLILIISLLSLYNSTMAYQAAEMAKNISNTNSESISEIDDKLDENLQNVEAVNNQVNSLYDYMLTGKVKVR